MYDKASVDDLNQIFYNTVILYKNIPYKVVDIRATREFVLEKVGKRDEDPIRVKITDEKLDYKPFRLGMCNLQGEAYYLSRIPKRQYQQGLGATTLKIQSVYEKNEGSRKEALHKKVLSTFNSESFCDCVAGKYPSIKEAVALLKKDDDEVNSVAFHRWFAIDRNFKIFFKDKNVGVYNEKGKKIIFLRNHEQYEELLDA